MKEIEKIINVTKNILNIYDQLLDIELYNKKEDSFQQKLEDLKLLKEIEYEYYQELEKKYSLEELMKIERNLNVDDIAKIKLNDLDFSILYVSDEEILKRRIYNNLSNIVMNKIENNMLFDNIKEQIGNFNFYRQSFILGDEEILVLNRSKTVIKIQKQAIYNIYLKYLYYIQLYINKNHCRSDLINSKFNLLFINKELENKLINEDFKISLKKTKEEFSINADQKLYNYFLKNSSLNYFSIAISEYMHISDDQLNSFGIYFYMYFFEAIIRSSALQLNEEIIEQFKHIINEVEDEDFKIVKKKLLNILKVTKKDKDAL